MRAWLRWFHDRLAIPLLIAALLLRMLLSAVFAAGRITRLFRKGKDQ